MFQEIDGTSESILSFINKEKSVSYPQLQQRFPKLDKDDYLYAYLQILYEEKLLTYDDRSIMPTARGLVYFEMRLKYRINLFVKTVIAPLTVYLIMEGLTK